MKIGIVGAAGRMGRMNVATVINSNEATLSAALEREGSEFIGQNAEKLAGFDNGQVTIIDNKEEFIKASDAIIDFSTPESTLSLAKLASENNVVHVIGTTGLSTEHETQLAEHAQNTKIVYAPNMSVGVNLLFELTKKVAATLDIDYDIEIVEMHHNKKLIPLQVQLLA
jgi:4-hydroxy-tetrahydrodipicolinate reductase